MTEAAPSARELPIAMFDSGVGGLTVLDECLVSMPHEDFVYLGDTARFPYGVREPAELRRLAEEITRYLLDAGAKLLVVACNSATAAALEHVEGLLAEAGRPGDVIGVVGPESEQAVRLSSSGRVGLLATPTTVASGAYQRAVARADPDAQLTAVACPELAPIIQSGFPFDERVVETARSYCAPLREAGVDVVILGCTHYPLVRQMLRRFLGRGVRIVTSGAAVADRVERVLAERQLGNPRTGEGDYSFLCTGDIEAFRALGTRFLQMPLHEVSHVDVGELALAR